MSDGKVRGFYFEISQPVLVTIHVEETLATSNTKNQIASIKDFDTANHIQVKNLDEINNNVITTNTETAASENEIVEETPIVASGVDHNELCDQLDKASNVAIAKDTEKEKNHQEAPNNTPELELETQDKIKEQNNSDFLNEAIENTERCSSDNIIKSSIYHIGECYPKNTTKNEEENNIIADETNETKDDTNTLESATDEKDILETVPEILKDKVMRKILEQEICVISFFKLFFFLFAFYKDLPTFLLITSGYAPRGL